MLAIEMHDAVVDTALSTEITLTI